jgi:phosphosulfolactate phosphohydrolase-like enzyme
MMTNKIVVNCSTGEVQEIALTEVEIAEREAMAAEYAAQKAQEELDKAAKAEAKAELLDRLGITEDEAKLLLG